VIRAAARALDASLVLADRTGSVLAVAARSPADEASLMADADDVAVLELRVADEPVGTLRMRARSEPGPALVKLVTTLIGSEVERLRAPDRASEAATSAFLHAVLGGGLADRDQLLARGSEMGVDLADGGTIVVARAHPHVTAEDGWRSRVLAVAERGARAVVAGSIAALAEREDVPGAEVVVLVPGSDEATAKRATDGLLRELQTGLTGYTFAIGRSRVAGDPLDLHRAANEALLAANVAEGDAERPVLAFEETGAYRLLLSAMSEDPAELQRFYAETVEPLVAYDEQYESDLVQTVEAFLEADGNVAGTAQRLFTHRHTIRYRLERVRELSGLDVGSTDGREKLSLGLKAMRVLGIAHRGGPATEAGAEAGRVPRR
jgi:sugar diacid utilization regulator